MRKRHHHLGPHSLRARVLFAIACVSALACVSAPPSTAAAVTSAAAVPMASAAGTLAPPAAFVRTDESTGRLVYVGPWRRAASASYSGGSARVVPTRGALAAMRFTGTAVRWVGARGPSLGRAEVYVDGRYVATVDQSAARASTKQVVWRSATLAAGTHRLEIHVLGKRGTYGSGADVNVDAIDVRGSALVPGPPSGFVRIEERDARVTRFGSWKPISNGSASGGECQQSATNGSGYMIAFTGNAVSITGPVGPSLGKGYVYVDGVYVGATHQKSSVSRQHQLLWSKVGLTSTAHLIEVRPQAPTAVAVNALALDAVYINGAVSWAPRRIEERDGRLGVAGTWGTATSRGMSGNTYRYCPSGGGTLALRFTGPSVRVLGLRSPSSGEAEVLLDGVSRGIINLHASSTRVQQILWRASGLGSGVHELQIRALGSAAAGSRGERVGIDGFDISGTVTSTPNPTVFTPVEEDDARLSAAGVWTNASNTSMSSRAYAQSADDDGVLTVSFQGTGLRWIGPRSSGHGVARVFVDGTLDATVSQYAATKRYRQEIWLISGLAPGPHTVQIRVAGAADGNGTRKPVAVDALHVLGGGLREAPRPAGVARIAASDGRTAAAGVWALTATSADATQSEIRTRDVRSGYSVRFRGTSVTWVGSRGPDFGTAELVLDGKSRGVVDLYDYAANPKRVLWSSRGLTDREHVLAIRLTGRRNRASTSFVVGVDALDVAGEILDCGTRTGADDWRLSSTGTWSSHTTTISTEVVRASQQTSSTLTARFSGTGFSLMGVRSVASGIASISVDWGPWVGVDLYSAEPQKEATVLEVGSLRVGQHTVRVFVTGRQNPAATGRQIGLTGLEVYDGDLMPQTAVQKARLKAVDTAIAQLGKRYVWAGAGPTVFDCSGLMLYSYKAVGMVLPHYSGSQWRLCVPRRVGELLPGDLCFTDNPGYIHHVGMYIGEGITINAPGSGRYVEYRAATTYGCFGRLKTSLWPK